MIRARPLFALLLTSACAAPTPPAEPPATPGPSTPGATVAPTPPPATSVAAPPASAPVPTPTPKVEKPRQAPRAPVVDGVDFAARAAPPKGYACDGALDEWGALVPDGAGASSHVAVSFTPQQAVVAGDVDGSFAGGVWLWLSFPAIDLMPIGYYQRGGGVRELECDNKPYTTEPRTPADRKRCLEILARHAKLQKREDALFRRLYRVDVQGVRVLGDKGTLEAIDGSAAAFNKRGDRIAFEVTLPALALPRVGLSPLDSVGLSVSSALESAPPGWGANADLTIDPAVSFAPDEALWSLLLAFMGRFTMGPRISYQPGKAGEVEVVFYKKGQVMTVSAARRKAYTLGPKLGKVQIGFLFDEARGAVVFVDGAPKDIISTGAKRKALARDGALHVISADEYFDDASARPTASWSFAHVAPDGTVTEGELEPWPTAWDSVGTYHDATWSVLGLRGRAATDYRKSVPLDVEWKWMPDKHQYVRVKPAAK